MQPPVLCFVVWLNVHPATLREGEALVTAVLWQVEFLIMAEKTGAAAAEKSN